MKDSPFSNVVKRQREKNEQGIHPFIKGLYRLSRVGGYTIYTNDTYTSGTIECPSGWVDNWIRYEGATWKDYRFAYDAPNRVPTFVRQTLIGCVMERLEAENEQT